MPSVTSSGYHLIAKGLGKALGFIKSRGDSPMQTYVVIDSIMAELEQDNPAFDRDIFMQAVNSAAEDVE